MIDVDLSNQIGILQEKILSEYNLSIYHIEYSEMNVKESISFVLGSNKMLFDDTLEYFLKREDLKFEDIKNITIYDKKSDNIIIERYNEWYKNIYKNRRLLRFPIEIILANILRIDSIQDEDENDHYNTFKDVKVTLNQDEFNNLEKFNFNLNETKECLICLENFKINDQVTKIHCNHIFHTTCIKEWLLKENSKCPVCRIDVKY
jgi:hypothetical protein